MAGETGSEIWTDGDDAACTGSDTGVNGVWMQDGSTQCYDEVSFGDVTVEEVTVGARGDV